MPQGSELSAGAEEDQLDILESSLELLGSQPVQDSSSVSYGSVVVTSPQRWAGKANALLADQVFNPGLVTAEQIESGRIRVAGQCVVELGCGSGIPSLIAASVSHEGPPKLVVMTDYPDDALHANLESNIQRNATQFRCPVQRIGYEWGENIHELLNVLPAGQQGFDVVIMADLLHLTPPIAPLLTSMTSLLAHTPSARAYVSVGSYTSTSLCQGFIKEAEKAGLQWTKWDLEAQGQWGGSEITGLGCGPVGMEWLWKMKQSVAGWIVCWALSEC